MDFPKANRSRGQELCRLLGCDYKLYTLSPARHLGSNPRPAPRHPSTLRGVPRDFKSSRKIVKPRTLVLETHFTNSRNSEVNRQTTGSLLLIASKPAWLQYSPDHEGKDAFAAQTRHLSPCAFSANVRKSLHERGTTTRTAKTTQNGGAATSHTGPPGRRQS